MPTGYTSGICDGEESFAFFVLKCARAFGACISQRDDPLTELPEPPEASTYHENQLLVAESRYRSLKKMSLKAREKYGEKCRREDIAHAKKQLAKKLAVRDRLTSMLAKVEEWSPPSPDHYQLKKFMVEQLTQTLEWDGDPSYYQTSLAEAEKANPLTYYNSALEGAQYDIQYHTKHKNNDISAAENKGKWIRELYESLQNEKDLSWALIQK